MSRDGLYCAEHNGLCRTTDYVACLGNWITAKLGHSSSRQELSQRGSGKEAPSWVEGSSLRGSAGLQESLLPKEKREQWGASSGRFEFR